MNDIQIKTKKSRDLRINFFLKGVLKEKQVFRADFNLFMEDRKIIFGYKDVDGLSSEVGKKFRLILSSKVVPSDQEQIWRKQI